ncbi:MAG: formylglycine-generating enzyme family protein, partial [Kiritimatiellae bacterium]|nr:formylglycine-generating enzyme family protein [Kiritimatiellia bacterium]
GDDGAVVITYALSGGPAVVTLDIETNSTGGAWASIGLENVYGGTTRAEPAGDVSKVVSGSSGTIVWRPAMSWPDCRLGAAPARAVVTAWPVDDTPQYLAVDISPECAAGERVKYYVSSNAVPGGVLGNPAWRTSRLLLRRINAKNVDWTMGASNEIGKNASSDNGLGEAAHAARLTNDYYIAVFPTTQTQWRMLTTSKSAEYKVEGAMRPMESICFNAVRCCSVGNTAAESGTDWPNPPYSASWLGLLRDRTQIDFDLPGEGEWEFACRAGHGDGYWGTGEPITSATEDSKVPGRYLYNQAIYGNTSQLSSEGPKNCTPVVGSYAPNIWGIYDQCGGVREMCLDWSLSNCSSLGGLVNTTAATKRIIRGGDYKSQASKVRPAYRDDANPAVANAYMGFRVACRAGLQ